MDLISTGTDPWILEYDACEKVAREIMEHLNSRNSDKISIQAQDALSAKIRIRLKQYSTEVNVLNRKLNAASLYSSITPEERERRKRQVEALQSKEVQLRELFDLRRQDDYRNSDRNQSRAQLFKTKGPKSTFSDSGTTSWGGNTGSSVNAPDNKTIQEMKEEQEKLLKEQNEGLESLLKIVSAQTQIAHSISNEVDHHNDILVDIADGMESVDERLNRATNMVKVVGKKESIWGYWLVAFLLFIAILGVALS